jgi:hypothetical protein
MSSLFTAVVEGLGNTECHVGQKDLVSHSNVLVPRGRSEAGMRRRLLAAVVSKATKASGLEEFRHSLDKVKRSSF